MNMSGSGPAPRRTPRKKIKNEARLLRRDGLRQYLRVLRLKRRFDRSVRGL